MSKVAVSQYSIRMEAERRARRKKIEEVRQVLSRCLALRKKLEKLGQPGDEDGLAETLDRYNRAVRNAEWEAAASDYDRLYDELPALERRLEESIVAAKEKRLRLELTAATLSANAVDQAEEKLLAKIVRGAAKSRTSELGELGKQLEVILTKRLEAAAKGPDRELTASQLELARELMHRSLPAGKRLGATPGRETGGKPAAPPKDAQTRIDQLVTRLASLDEDVSDLLDRARALSTDADAARRNLQLDSLMFEAAERVNERRRERELDRLAGAALAELAPFEGEQSEQLRSDIVVALEKRDRLLLEKLGREVSVYARAEAARRDAVVAREAVLRGLTELGYEIRMNGARWDEGTRIEAQRPEELNYDIELSAAANGKIQSKVRAYEHAGRSSGATLRDIEVEESWCDDLRRLHRKLEAEGIEAEIEDEKKPGSAAQRPLPARAGNRDRRSPTAARRQRDIG
jgi:hypothetical protein